MLGLVSMLSTEYIKENDPQLEVEQLSERTTSFIDDWSKSLGEKVKTDRLDQLESTLLKGLDDGSSVDKIAKELFDNEIREEYYQCKRIALTEVLRAHSMSQLEAIEQDPSVTHKVWRHTGGGMTSRPNHLAIDGQTVPKDKPFTLIGADGVTYHPSMPHDPSLPAGESINCHCMLERVTDESILGLSLEEREALRDKARDEIGDEWTFDLKSNVDNSSEKFYNLSSKYDTPITNKSISALKKVEINGLSQEQSGYAYTHRKELLKSMQNESVGVEGSICFSMDNKFISTVRVGGYGETPISDAPFNYYAIHNHPDNAVLSPRDLSLFLKREHMIGIESIGNNGTSVTSIVKTVESDIVGYADYVNSIIDEIEKNSDIYTNMEVQELNEICTDLLKRGEDYGFKVTIK